MRWMDKEGGGRGRGRRKGWDGWIRKGVEEGGGGGRGGMDKEEGGRGRGRRKGQDGWIRKGVEEGGGGAHQQCFYLLQTLLICKEVFCQGCYVLLMGTMNRWVWSREEWVWPRCGEGRGIEQGSNDGSKQNHRDDA